MRSTRRHVGHEAVDPLGHHLLHATSFRKVLLPAASPAVLVGLGYSIAIAWMTAVGAEMLMVVALISTARG